MPRHVPVSRYVVPAAAALLALLASAGCSGDGDSDPGSEDIRSTPKSPIPASHGKTPAGGLPAELTRQRPDWSPCPAPDPAQGAAEKPAPLPDGTAWECATLKVPLDYTKPRGRTIGIEMVRARKEDGGGKRIGSLLFNFGGPGGSGVAALPSFGKDYAALHTRYDLVSFDPRGVGGSEGVSCLGTAALDSYFAADWTPDSGREETELVTRHRAFATGCGDRAGFLLPHLTTENTARDMDLMRQVLGDRKLHYFGVSYGTQLGGVYAHLFPDKVGRAVLDAVVDPKSTPRESSVAQTEGFQLALENYLEDCADKGDECPVGEDPEEAQKRIADLLSDLDRKPMPTRDSRMLTESLATGGISQSLYSKDLWGYLTDGLREALEDGDGTTLLLLSDSLNGRNPDGTYSTLQSSLAAINCADSEARFDAGDVKEAEGDFADASPVFGRSSAWQMIQCEGWPVTGRGDSPQVGAEGADPMLLIGTTGDPATPYAGTRNMKEELGEGSAVELTYKGEGHGAYDSKNRCVRKKVDGYLLKGDVPPDGSSCG